MFESLKNTKSYPAIQVIMVFFCFCSIFIACNNKNMPAKKAVRAVNGVLDLSNWDFNESGAVELDGEWDFYWKKLLTHKDFNKNIKPQKTGAINIPSVWNSYKINDINLPGDGYATFILKIKMKPSSEMMALSLPIISSAYSVLFNKEKFISTGVVGASKSTMIPLWLPKIKSFVPTDETIQVIVQVSNFMYRRGGIRQSIVIGTEKQIREVREKALLLEQALLGSLILMGLYHFGLFAFRRKDKSVIYFGIICFLTAVRIVTTGSHLLNQHFDVPWELTLKLEYISFYFSIPFFILFLKTLYPQEISKIMVWVLLITGTFFSIIVVFTNPSVYTRTVSAYQIITIFYAIYSLFALAVAAYKNREGARIFILGWLILIVAVINDILYSHMIIFTGNVAPIGFFIFIFFQSYILSGRFSKSFILSEKLSAELEDMVLHLEEMVEERTRKLTAAYETIKEISIKDTLTGCYNRRYLEEQLPREVQRVYRYNQIFSIILCDIDFFKKVNDQHGHLAGDAVLVEFIQMLTSITRKDIDWIARYGGEEFLIIMPQTELKKASVIAERMRELIEKKLFKLADKKIQITASFGVSEFQEATQDINKDIDLLLKSVDDKLYKAKNKDRNCVIY